MNLFLVVSNFSFEKIIYVKLVARPKYWLGKLNRTKYLYNLNQYKL